MWGDEFIIWTQFSRDARIRWGMFIILFHFDIMVGISDVSISNEFMQMRKTMGPSTMELRALMRLVNGPK